MEDGRILSIIQTLERVRERRAMYVSGTASAVSDFLGGFDNACYALGLPLPFEWRQLAKEERGWPRTAEVWPLSAMTERGLNDDEMADEMFALDIVAWRLMGGKQPPP